MHGEFSFPLKPHSTGFSTFRGNKARQFFCCFRMKICTYSLNFCCAYTCLFQVGGWTQVYGDILSFATIRGASHEAPFSQPERSLVLFKSFIEGKPLPLEFWYIHVGGVAIMWLFYCTWIRSTVNQWWLVPIWECRKFCKVLECKKGGNIFFFLLCHITLFTLLFFSTISKL